MKSKFSGKFLILLLIVCIVTTAFYSCGKKNNSSSSNTDNSGIDSSDINSSTNSNINSSEADTSSNENSSIEINSSNETIENFSNYITVISCGAKGNGKTDDSAAINKAIGLAAENGTIVFTNGSYLINSNITFPKGIAVKIDDGAKLIISSSVILNFQTGTIDANNNQIFYGDGEAKGFEYIYSVKIEWWGAVANDNKDDSAAIQKALKASGKLLVLKEGNYNINNTIDIGSKGLGVRPKGIELRGAGIDKTKFIIADGVTAFKNDNSKTKLGPYAFNGITFEGASGSNKTAEALYIICNMNITNCSFKNLKRAIYGDDAGYSCFVNNKAYNTETVIDIGKATMFIYFGGNYTENCGTFTRIIGAGAQTTGIQFYDNECRNSTGIDIIASFAGGDTLYINNCRFYGGTGETAILAESILYPNFMNNIIEPAAGSNKNGITISGCSHDVYVKNNIIKNCYYGLFLKSNYAANIYGNSISMSKAGDLFMISCNTASVTNNNFLSNIKNPISGRGTNKYLTISENRFAAQSYDILSGFSDIYSHEINNNSFGCSN